MGYRELLDALQNQQALSPLESFGLALVCAGGRLDDLKTWEKSGCWHSYMLGSELIS